MNARLIIGKKHTEQIGYFVIREEEGSAEIEVQDAPPLETREEAEAWIAEHGIVGVDYWVCAPVSRMSVRRASSVAELVGMVDVGGEQFAHYTGVQL